MTEQIAPWEYYIEYLTADVTQYREFVQQFYRPAEKVPPFAIQSTIPRLNELGAMGWELVQFQPVLNVWPDGSVTGPGERTGTNTFLCVFKRRKA